MLQRTFFLILLISLTTSCQFFTADKKLTEQEIEEIVDFSVVDVSPSFAVCDTVIDKVAKTACFRETLFSHVSKDFSEVTLEVVKPVDTTLFVHLLIDNDGNVHLKEIQPSDVLRFIKTDLDSLIRKSLEGLPTLFPAIKRGIPVTTQYNIPIKIKAN